MNSNFRRIGYAGSGGLVTDLDINGDGRTSADRAVGLAEYFGVAPSTVRSWLQPAGRNIIIANDSMVAGNQYYGAIGKRVYCLQPPQITKTDPRNSLRVRLFLAATIAYDGLVRIPVHTGTTRVLHFVRPVLSGCLRTMDNIYRGGETAFLDSGWIEFSISGKSGSWDLAVYYNNIASSQGSDVIGEDEEEDDTDGSEPGCP